MLTPMRSASKQSKRGAFASAKKGPTTYATPALDKGLDILEVLSVKDGGLTKSELAREMDRTVSEIFRMLVCLERRGYIVQTTGERYVLTLKLFQMVQQYPPTERLMTEALPVMKRLVQRVGQSCHLAVLDGDSIAIVAQVNSQANLGFYVKLGSAVDLFDSASGYVILAYLTERDRASIMTQWRTRTLKKPPADLRKQLSRIRKSGFELWPSFQVKGVINISFPVLGAKDAVLGALTIPYIQYNHAQASKEKIIEELRHAAAEISISLGAKI